MLVQPAGIEPASMALQTTAMTTLAKVAKKLVSVAGFEPATPSPPDLCATGLRYTKIKSPVTWLVRGEYRLVSGALTRYRSWVSTLPM